QVGGSTSFRQVPGSKACKSFRFAPTNYKLKSSLASGTDAFTPSLLTYQSVFFFLYISNDIPFFSIKTNLPN
ncbi:hypothetical protein DRI50_04515, partial [candidate division KSB1 bacterium]